MDNRQIVITALPQGKLEPDHFALRSVAVPEPDAGEVLCRTLALTVGAGQRAGLQGSASYAGAPRTGIVMGGSAVARVEESNADAVPVGALVTCPAGWQDYSLHKAGAVQVVEGGGDPAHHLACTAPMASPPTSACSIWASRRRGRPWWFPQRQVP